MTAFKGFSSFCVRRLDFPAAFIKHCPRVQGYKTGSSVPGPSRFSYAGV